MISIAIASCRDIRLLRETLDTVLPQALLAGARVTVARPNHLREASSDAEFDEWGCRVVWCAPDSSIPQLRGAALSASTGDWVALTEDNCVAAPGWLGHLRAGASSAVQVVGGSMGNARPGRAIDAGAAYAEYGFFGPDRAGGGGRAPLVTGATVMYHRSVVEQVSDWAVAGDWEDVIHGRLCQADVRFAVLPDAMMLQNLEYRLGDFCMDRYQHGRDYARVRARDASLGMRVRFIAATPVLPVVLAWRIWRSAGRATPAQFARALPWTVTFLSAWAAGEAVGYLTAGREHG
ncbi:MAG: glycosyltransferase [Gemmatimonadales bacterium]